MAGGGGWRRVRDLGPEPTGWRSCNVGRPVLHNPGTQDHSNCTEERKTAMSCTKAVNKNISIVSSKKYKYITKQTHRFASAMSSHAKLNE